MYRTDFGTLWEKTRVGCFERTASKHIYYLGWNRSSAQAGCMRQVLEPGALGRPRRMGLGGRWEGGLGWGTHVNPWLIHVNIWQKPLQYCKVISLQLIKINENNNNNKVMSLLFNMLSRLVIAFLPKSKCFLISWLLSPSAVILEPPPPKQSVSVSTVFLSVCCEVMEPDAIILVFWMLSFKPTFSLSSFTFIKRLFSFLCFLP